MSENTAPTLAELNRHLFANMLPGTHGPKRGKAPAAPAPELDPAAAEEQRLALELAASLTSAPPPA